MMDIARKLRTQKFRDINFLMEQEYIFSGSFEIIAKHFLVEYLSIENIFQLPYIEILSAFKSKQGVVVTTRIDMSSEYNFYKDITQKYIGIYTLPSVIYEKTLRIALDDLAKINASINYFIEKSNDSSDSYEKSKLEYLIKKNTYFKDDIINFLTSELKSYVLKKSMNDSFRTNPFMVTVDFDYPYEYSNKLAILPYIPKSFIEIKIKFMHLPIREVNKILISYKESIADNNYSDYLTRTNEYIDEYGIMDYLREAIEGEHYIKRRNLLKIAFSEYGRKNYDIFVNIVSMQIEGVLVDFCDFSGIDLKKQDYLGEKLDKIEEKYPFWGYQYFRYDFPKFRNTIVHGKYLDGDYNGKPLELIANELLLDLTYLVDTFVDAATPFKSLRTKINEINEKLMQGNLDGDMLIENLISIFENKMESDFLFSNSKDYILRQYGFLVIRDEFIGLLSDSSVTEIVIEKINLTKSSGEKTKLDVFKKMIEEYSKVNSLKSQKELIAKALYN